MPKNRHLLSVLFLAACSGGTGPSQDNPDKSAIAIPAAMQGCWESVVEATDGEPTREFFQIERDTVSTNVFTGGVWDHVRIQDGLTDARENAGILHSIVVASASEPGRTYHLWMENEDYLRIGGYWDVDDAEPDPEFTRCKEQ